MELIEAIKSRHSVRKYTDQPIDVSKLATLRKAIEEANAESGLNIQLVVNEPEAFGSKLHTYGTFSGVKNYLVMAAPKGREWEEKVGYYGEKIVILAQSLGLNTCWAGLTYKKVAGAFTLRDGDIIHCEISLGYGENQGVQHPQKPADRFYEAEGEVPEWFKAGVEAALLAKRHLLLLVIMIGTVLSATAQQVIDLSGTWKLALGDKQPYNDNVTLPGSLLTNGKGDEVTSHTVWTGSTYDSSYYFNPYMEKYRVEGNIKYPFFLTPEKHYVGNAWYKKTVMVPATWQGEHIYLYLERPHIETTVYVNGQRAGHQLSLSTPHQYDITPYVKAGKNNEIVVCVYNGIENVCVGQDSHSVTDQTQGNWNGITGCMELRTAPTPHIRISHDLATHTATIQMDDDTYQVSLGKTIHYWNEFDPYLYTRIINHHGIPYTVTFGIRDISIERRQIYLNHQPIWFRGTVENCCFPETGYPPTDVESWLRIMRKVKEYGLNHIRFHSYCPPDAAFTAADIVGIYLQPEGPSWPNHGVKLRAGQKIDQYLLEESKRIIDTYGHHPSFVMMAAGNEPAGDWVSYCNDWVKEMKKYDSSKIYCGASVGGGWAWDNGSEYHVKGGARGLDWNNRAPHSDDDYLDQIAFPRNYRDSVANSSPIIAHEQGQWCAFPDFREISQYTGAYKAKNFEIFQDLLRDNGMGYLSS